MLAGKKVFITGKQNSYGDIIDLVGSILLHFCTLWKDNLHIYLYANYFAKCAPNSFRNMNAIQNGP